DARVDPVANSQVKRLEIRSRRLAPVAPESPTSHLRAHDAREAEEVGEDVRVVDRYALAGPDLQVKIQERRAVGFAAQQPFPHEVQVAIFLLRPAGQEKGGAEAVHQAMRGRVDEWKSGSSSPGRFRSSILPLLHSCLC